jgi:hypothetical protein
MDPTGRFEASRTTPHGHPLTASSVIRDSLPDGFDQFAYSAPFRVLSEEGLKEMRKVVLSHKCEAKATNRAPKVLRGLGYRSDFVRDLAYSPQLHECLSSLCGEAVWPHNHPMNIAHTNFGEPGGAAKVDDWHLDSVDYVLVLIISDMEGECCAPSRAVVVSSRALPCPSLPCPSLSPPCPSLSHSVFCPLSIYIHLSLSLSLSLYRSLPNQAWRAVT